MNENKTTEMSKCEPIIIGDVSASPCISFFNMDNLEFMKSKPDKCYNLIIADPPYGINVAKMAYTQEDNRPCKQKNGKTLRVKKLKYKHGDWDKSIPSDEYFNELFRISKEQIIFGINYFDLKNVGNGRIKWNKCVPEGVSFNNYEYAYCSMIDYEMEFTYMWAGMCQGKSLSEPTTQQGNKKKNETRIHPTHKPVLLYRWILQTFAQNGWKLLDPNGGGMSIAIAAEELGFDLDIVEIDNDYFKSGTDRFRLHKRQQRLSF